MNKTIYFDESGFTGYNYLDPLQPFFTLASHDLDPEFCEEVLKKSFPKYNGGEFKFATLWKSRRKEFLDLAKNLEPYGEHIKLWVIDKRFAVVIKMVDFLIEPAVTAAGYDFLAKGFGRKLTNHIYFGLEQFGTEGATDELIAAYQAFSRNPSKESLRELTKIIKSVTKRQPIELRRLLAQMVDGAVNFETFSNLDTFRSSNDLQFTSMLAAVADWQRVYTDDKTIIHDASSNFLRQRDVWDQITGMDVEEQLHPLGDGTFIPFPLKVIGTHSVDSKDNYAIQLCDLLAGFASRHFDLSRPDEEREIMDKMVNAGLYATSFNGLRPAHDFPSGPPEKLNGPDAVDRMIKMMKGK